HKCWSVLDTFSDRVHIEDCSSTVGYDMSDRFHHGERRQSFDHYCSSTMPVKLMRKLMEKLKKKLAKE
ncbi:hypothetical protein BGX27_004640, partial [Mortierella sp. AM989]